MKNFRVKLLTILEVLYKTDETTPISIPRMLDILSKKGIKTQRKSVYEDIIALKKWGLDISYSSKSPSGYFLTNPLFNPIEIKILVDAISASDFLTISKSESLNSRLLSLTSTNQSESIEKQIHLNPKKFNNEQIYFTLNILQRAIQSSRSIQFKYFDLNYSKQKKYRKNGAYYVFIPYALIYENQRYYCIGYNEKYASFSHYRIDKMDNIRLLEKIEHVSFDLKKYQESNFNMTFGQLETITMEVHSSLLSTIYDSFGQNIIIQNGKEDMLLVTLQTALSPSFIGWVFQFGTKIKVISPQHCVDEITVLLNSLLKQYT